MASPVIFWDVDTQYDFMRADGKLYVPGSEEIIPALRDLTRHAHDRGIPIVASVRAGSEVARIVERSGGGWVTSLHLLPETLAAAFADRDELAARGVLGQTFALKHFMPDSGAEQFDQILVGLAQSRENPPHHA